MHEQLFNALKEVDLVIFLMDGKEGLHPLDEIVCSMLREQNINFIVAINKIDSDEREINVAEFYRLGVDNLISISASHGRNVDELLDRIVELCKDEEYIQVEGLKLVVVGRPNVGNPA